MQEIILFLLHSPGGTNYHYATRYGRDLTFVLNRETGRHEVRISLEEWRRENFYFAKNILDQSLTVPILFDVTDIPTQAEIAPALPVAEEQAIVDDAEDEDEAPRTTIVIRPRAKGRKVNLNR